MEPGSEVVLIGTHIGNAPMYVLYLPIYRFEEKLGRNDLVKPRFSALEAFGKRAYVCSIPDRSS